MFGISMSAVGMLSIVGMIISNDAYGPIGDNARACRNGRSWRRGFGKERIALGSAGNTVKAITKALP